MAKEEGFLLLLSPSLRWAASGSSQFPSLGLMGTDLSFRAQQKWGCDVGRNSSSASSRSCELCRACWVCGPVPHNIPEPGFHVEKERAAWGLGTVGPSGRALIFPGDAWEQGVRRNRLTPI